MMISNRYVRLPTGVIAIDPDQQVQSVVHMVFDQFDELGSINAVLRYLVRQNIRMPVLPHGGLDRGHLQWRHPNRQTLRSLLSHPIYAGAYAWGRRPTDPRRKIPGRPGTGRIAAPPEQWQVLIKDCCSAYITWDRYQANQRRIADNRSLTHTRGAVREGPALLKGLLRCSHCGRRMTVRYRSADPKGGHRRPYYVCVREVGDYGGNICQNVVGDVLDQRISQQVLTVLEPAALDLSLAAAGRIDRQRAAMDQHWLQRLERARYESDRAGRQYHVVEPENRLVGRELERQWEQRLADQRTVQEEYDRVRREQPEALTDADRALIQDLAADIPKRWHSPETTHVDRQMIVRHLIEEVIVAARHDSEHVDLTVRWVGGFTSQISLVRPVARYDQLDCCEQLIERILELREQGRSSPQIADQLNADGFRPPGRRTRTFNSQIIRSLLCRRGLTQKQPAANADQLSVNEWWFEQFVQHAGVPATTLYHWIRRGWVHARQLSKPRGRWVVWADADELKRLRELRNCRRGWFNQPPAELTRPKVRRDKSGEL